MSGYWLISALLLGVLCCGQCVVRMAWLANVNTVYFFNASTSLGALATSIDTIEDNDNILPGETFDIKFRDSSCNSKAGVGAIFELLEDPTWQPDLILGPVCTPAMEPVAQVASYLNKPIFAWIASNPSLSDKSIYTTLIRTLWPITNLADGLMLLMDKFNWKRVLIISTKGGDYGALGSSVKDKLEENDYDVVRWVQGVEVGASPTTINAIYNRVKREARIVVLVTPENELRDWTLAASKNGMSSGDYAFIYLNQQTADPWLYASLTSKDFYERGDSDDARVRQAMFNVFIIIAKTKNFNITDQDLAEYSRAAHSDGWKNRFPEVPPAQSDFYSLFLWDAMKIFSIYGASRLSEGGEAIFQAARGSYTEGRSTGDIILDDQCDRIPDYYIMKMTDDDVFGVIGSTKTVPNGPKRNRSIIFTGELIWGSGERGVNNAPLDAPPCGFYNELCPPLVLYIVPAVVGFLLIVGAIIAYFVYRKISYERELANMAWKLNYADINVYGRGGGPMRAQSLIRKSRASFADSTDNQVFITTGNYRGTKIAIKQIRKTKIDINRTLLQEMTNMMDLKHQNLNTFIGACTEAPNIVVAWEYCSKGSLQDVIYGESMKLDDMFKFCLATDILKGLVYLHESSLHVHGRLRSSNILVDGRWSCKVCGFGLQAFTHGQDEDDELSPDATAHRFLWTAPEALRDAWEKMVTPVSTDGSNSSSLPSSSYAATTQQADIYSVGIVLKELMCLNEPYAEEETLTVFEILDKIRNPPEDAQTFRPSLTELSSSVQCDKTIAQKLSQFIQELWVEDPRMRPTAAMAQKKLAKLSPLKNLNVVDNMNAMMEKYSAHLEELVLQKTVEFREEQKKAETLLYRMLPVSIADDLKSGKNISAEQFESVTIYFSDIFGFTEFTNQCQPIEVVDFLNAVYILFDETIEQHGVYKVETVMDVYVLVSGLPKRNGDIHIIEMANCAMDIMNRVLHFKLPGKPEFKLKIRIGIHTGPIVTGVVGLTMPRYCLFGDTMNTASRMESHGAPMRIHMSPEAYAALSKFNGYLCADRGKVQIKGKGQISTYWLLGRQGYNKRLPDFDEVFGEDDPAPLKLPPTRGKVALSRSQSLSQSLLTGSELDPSSPSRRLPGAPTGNGSAKGLSPLPPVKPVNSRLTPVDGDVQ